MKTYFAFTRANITLSKVLLWRAFPSGETQAGLAQRHVPTALQLVEESELVIDIIPFPSIRDRLLMLHSADPTLMPLFVNLQRHWLSKSILQYLLPVFH